MGGERSYKELFRESLKSTDTEEWLDIYFNRPVGFCITLIGQRLNIHPNTITLISIVLGILAAIMFYHHDILHNLLGVLFLMTANFCDSADGQLARITGKKTLLGRALDGFAGDVWFFCIYASLCLRMMPQQIPFTDMSWGYSIWALAFVAGILCHTRQASLGDYYRQIHLFFLFQKGNDELNRSQHLFATYRQLPRKEWFARFFYLFYGRYCRSQERRTPMFQHFFEAYLRYADDHDAKVVRELFLAGSRPLMKYTNILTFNVRAICLYITCLADQPWIYFVFEILILLPLYLYMQARHEQLCVKCTARMNG
ncbi:MAG: CDP-alcohol phosphatidyltransferase family protein [Prevotella sp.]|nr:CDP-alcohol phosphatidyltransferase family protein [Prevotella sp.]